MSARCQSLRTSLSFLQPTASQTPLQYGLLHKRCPHWILFQVIGDLQTGASTVRIIFSSYTSRYIICTNLRPLISPAALGFTATCWLAERWSWMGQHYFSFSRTIAMVGILQLLPLIQSWQAIISALMPFRLRRYVQHQIKNQPKKKNLLLLTKFLTVRFARVSLLFLILAAPMIRSVFRARLLLPQLILRWRRRRRRQVSVRHQEALVAIQWRRQA